MKTAVIIFPGSNCDQDVLYAVRNTLGTEVRAVWHGEREIPDGTDLVILPGGFSYGDYLRCGAMAARSPVMQAVIDHGRRGGLLLGICNGFQVLTETRLLPGALLTNRIPAFICRPCLLRVESTATPFTSMYAEGQVVQFPIAHADGRYTLPDDELKALEDRGGVVFRYCDGAGNVTEESNPNGAMNGIAGIVNEGGNILGLMPHPERASEAILGGVDGCAFWRSIFSTLQERRV